MEMEMTPGGRYDWIVIISNDRHINENSRFGYMEKKREDHVKRALDKLTKLYPDMNYYYVLARVPCTEFIFEDSQALIETAKANGDYIDL
jgi:hypothetical protein